MKINEKAAGDAASQLKALFGRYAQNEKKRWILRLFELCSYDRKKVRGFFTYAETRTINEWISRLGLAKVIEMKRLEMILHEAKTNKHISSSEMLGLELGIGQTTLSQILVRHNKSAEVKRIFDARIRKRILLEARVNKKIKTVRQLAKAVGMDARESLYGPRYKSIRKRFRAALDSKKTKRPTKRKTVRRL